MRFLGIGSGIFLLVLVSFVPFFTSTTKRHGCAPVTPPVVSGTLIQPMAIRGALFINEVLLTPRSTWSCSELGTYDQSVDTWVEIYNPQNQPLDLYAVHASIDSGSNTYPFYLPFGSAIAPHGFLVVFPRLEANFVATETSTLRLLIGSTAIDEVTIPTLGEDQSYAREPDGSSTWIITSIPTIDANNSSSLIQPTLTKTKVKATAGVSGSNNKGGNHHGGTNGSSHQETGGSNGSGGGGNEQQQAIAGMQPTWSTLKHPDTLTTTSPTSIQSSTDIPQVDNRSEIPHKIILTLLVIALAAALFWCWWLFRVPWSTKRPDKKLR